MDVTTDNFGEVRELITQKLLPKTKYVAFDLEFTGVRYQKFQRDHINYLPFEKYKKLKYVAQTYQILQLGLSLVVVDESVKIYPFNFYLFPRNPGTYDKNLTMQLGCVKFNAEHGMDWNKWINKGVNYVKLSEMNHQELAKGKGAESMIDYWSVDWREIGEKFIKKLKEMDKMKEGAQLHFELNKTTSIHKALVSLFNKYVKENNLSLTLKETDREDILFIKKITQKEREIENEKMLDESYGFALLFEQIWQKAIPWIGHNCVLDIMYVYANFVETLPQNYFDFKQILTQNGRSFFDTKYIGLKYSELSENGSRLEDIVKTIKVICPKPTEFTFEKPFNKYTIDKQILHEAGYDSYLTAWVYQQAMKLKDNLSEQCKNKLNINFSFFYMNLAEIEDEINPCYSDNILRVNVPIKQNEDIRVKRNQLVKIIRKELIDCEGSYSIHEGYRELFIEIKDQRQQVIKRVFLLQEHKKIEVTTFASFFLWQKERVNRDTKQKTYFYKGNQKKESGSEPQENPRWKKK